MLIVITKRNGFDGLTILRKSKEWWLIAMIDDATNEIPYAQLFPQDTLFANMHVLRRFIELKGIFMALYVDKAIHFKTTRHGGLYDTVESISWSFIKARLLLNLNARKIIKSSNKKN